MTSVSDRYVEILLEIMPAGFLPLRLGPVPYAFDDPEFIYELKYDGFRALCCADGSGRVQLISRNANVYKGFPRLSSTIADVLGNRKLTLDGEIVCFGTDGKPDYYDLLRRRSPQHFCAFDLISLDGQDLRNHSLIERKRLLRSLIPAQPCAVVYVDYIVGLGTRFFDACCRLDLEGIVAKHRDSRYAAAGLFRAGREQTPWAKIRNPHYSQFEGRRELFQRRRR